MEGEHGRLELGIKVLVTFSSILLSLGGQILEGA